MAGASCHRDLSRLVSPLPSRLTLSSPKARYPWHSHLADKLLSKGRAAPVGFLAAHVHLPSQQRLQLAPPSAPRRNTQRTRRRRRSGGREPESGRRLGHDGKLSTVEARHELSDVGLPLNPCCVTSFMPSETLDKELQFLFANRHLSRILIHMKH
ncbi:hypothetical protein NDU88_006640 [Pleurodeles waltl]|uniref:Uncharacterized protein n=1 Tax=Pleurodeles waltl TaxID=8319 RepID=A0AAV7LPS9_PLEWA|nr:hypothetical protein NDU88_006640 [Pleurodeles waltl]